MPKKYAIKESTRKRCRIFTLSQGELENYRPVCMEQFHYLTEVSKIAFDIYIRVGREMIEYIKAAELCPELVNTLWTATQRIQANVDVYVRIEDFQKFEATIDDVRSKKIETLIGREPRLDRKTLEQFHDLSLASQMVQRGGIDTRIANKASAQVSQLVSGILSNDQSASTLSKMISIDPTLYDHSASVAMFSGIVARKYKLRNFSKEEMETIFMCGLFHDAGKAHIPNCVLNKPGKFTEYEYSIMKRHTTLGYKEICHAISGGAEIDPVVSLVALEHHERMNGEGYPFKKIGRAEENQKNGIHLYSRIVAIADAYSALLMERCYKPALPADEAITLMYSRAKEFFDMEIFEPFANHVYSSLNSYTAPIKQFSRNEISKPIVFNIKGKQVELEAIKIV